MIATDFEPGTVVAGHRIEALVNSGGMGIVFRAVDTELDRTVAFKIIKPELASDDRFRERFTREARIVANIEHPNIIRIWRCGEEDGLLFVSMQYIEGTDLAGIINEHGRLSASRAARIVADVAAALDVAHSHGVVHRDIKPQNILIERKAEDERVVLTDFGLAKRLKRSQADLYRTREFVGTPGYAAPEQVRPKRVDARADIYALGCVFFHAVTGRLPFDAEDPLGMIIAHATVPPPHVTAVVPDLPGTLDSIVEKAMAKNPAHRYHSAGDLAQAVLTAAGHIASARPVGLVATGDAAPRADGDDADSPPPSSLVADTPAEVAVLSAGDRARLGETLRRAEGNRFRHRYSAALEDFKRALQIVPDSVDALAGRGWVKLKLRQTAEALADFEAVLERDPGSVYALTGRAGVRLAQGQLQAALDDYKTALALDTGSLDAMLGYADTLTQLRRYDEARAAVESALAIDPGAIDGLRLRAILAVHGRRLDAAKAAAEAGVQADPEAAQAYATRAFVRLADQDLEGALADLEDACHRDEGDAASRALRGLVLLRTGRPEQAVEELDAAIALDDRYAEAHAWRAIATLWLGMEDDARSRIERAIDINPRSGSACVAQGLQYMRAGQAKKALLTMDAAFENDRVGVLVWFGRDRVYIWRAEMALALGRYNEAAADSSRALDAAPDSAEAHVLHGRALLGLGRATDAVADFDAARQVAPSDATVLMHRSEAMFALNRFSDGLGDLDLAVAVAPDSKEAAAARRRAAVELPLDDATPASTRKLFDELVEALDARGIEKADQMSMAILRAASGDKVIDSEGKALAIDDRVLVKLDALWRAGGFGPLRKRHWLRSPEISTRRRLIGLESWLAWRVRDAGL